MFKYVSLAVVSSILLIPALATAATISINPNIPGVDSPPDLVSIVVNFYQFALLTGAVLAFGSIVYGAVNYALSESAGTKNDAKDRIVDAFIGLVLLAGAYLLLYTINPALTILTNPGLEKIPEVTTQSGTPSTNESCRGVPNGGCNFKADTAKQGCESAKDVIGKNAQECSTSPTPTECYKKVTCNSPTQGCSGASTCSNSYLGKKDPQVACKESPDVTKALAALQTNDPEIWNRRGQVTTTGGTHDMCSCHFGGQNCTDGGHAIDFGFAAGVGGIKDSDPRRIEAAIGKVGISAVCGCENSFDAVDCAQADHLHCNISAASCNCRSNFGK